MQHPSSISTRREARALADRLHGAERLEDAPLHFADKLLRNFLHRHPTQMPPSVVKNAVRA